MAKSILRAKYGDLVLTVEDYSDTAGRDWASQSPIRGDVHAFFDRGKRLRRTSCRLLFVEEPGQVESALKRAAAFEELAESGQSYMFLHPVRGSYEAIVEDYSPSVSAEDGTISVECVFAAQQQPPSVQDIGSGAGQAAGPEEVSAAAAKLEGKGVDDLLADAQASADEWATIDSPEVSAKGVILQALSMADRIQGEIDGLNADVDYANWDTFKALTLLRYKIERAAESATATTERIITLTVAASSPLIKIAADVYGARVAEERADEIAALNGMRDRGFVRAGTVLRMPADGAKT